MEANNFNAVYGSSLRAGNFSGSPLRHRRLQAVSSRWPIAFDPEGSPLDPIPVFISTAESGFIQQERHISETFSIDIGVDVRERKTTLRLHSPTLRCSRIPPRFRLFVRLRNPA
jgi:hypothetical protein